ncbi:hypothetical protein HKX48_000871, partial [Thoreauomyces humboldtii]
MEPAWLTDHPADRLRHKYQHHGREDRPQQERHYHPRLRQPSQRQLTPLGSTPTTSSDDRDGPDLSGFLRVREEYPSIVEVRQLKVTLDEVFAGVTKHDTITISVRRTSRTNERQSTHATHTFHARIVVPPGTTTTHILRPHFFTSIPHGSNEPDPTPPSVVYQIKEIEHPTWKRVGNDLHVTTCLTHCLASWDASATTARCIPIPPDGVYDRIVLTDLRRPYRDNRVHLSISLGRIPASGSDDGAIPVLTDVRTVTEGETVTRTTTIPGSTFWRSCSVDVRDRHITLHHHGFPILGGPHPGSRGNLVIHTVESASLASDLVVCFDMVWEFFSWTGLIVVVVAFALMVEEQCTDGIGA